MVASPRSAIPAPPRGAVARPRLDAMLDTGADGLLTLVAAPSGTGKTVLVSAWARSRAGAVHWVAVHESEGVEEIWRDVLTTFDLAPDPASALSTDLVDRAGAGQVVGPTSSLSEQVLDRVAEALQVSPEPVTLVLDCDGELPPEVASVTDRLLRRCADVLRLVVLARVDPQMALHRYRLEGTMTEIRTRDLAFTRGEAGELLAAAGLDLAPADVDTLTHRTQGWAAGLRLAALAIAPRSDPARAVRDLRGDTGMVSEYLVAEMLDQQPPDVREVLLRTSVVDVLRPGLVEALAGPRTPRVLAAMVRANVLLEELTDQPGWFRYHPLFRELLRAQLEYEAPDEHRSLHRSASGWYADHGCVEDAVRHAVAAEDWTRASSVVVDSLAAAQVVLDRASPLGGMLADLPEDLAGDAPALVRACLELRDRPGGALGPSVDPAPGTDATALPLVLRGEVFASPRGRLTSALLTLLCVSAACPEPSGVLAQTTADDVLSAASTARALLDAQPVERLAVHPEVRTIIRAGEGVGWLLRGDLDGASHAFAAGASDRYEPGRELPVIRCLAHLALVVAVRSELRRAAELAARTVSLCRAAGVQGGPEEGAAALALAWVCTETFDLDAARRHLARARTCGATASAGLDTLVLALVTARLSRAHGDAAGARDALHDAIERGPALPAWMRALLLRDAGGPGGTPAGAREELPETSPSMLVDALLVEASHHLASGATARARRVVVRSLEIAAPEHLRRPFREAPREVRQLLRLYPDLLTAHGWLVGGDHGEAQAPLGEPDVARGPAQQVLVPLTLKELEVLGHLDALDRTEDIAGAMFITVNTVRTHIRHILQKLDATRRNEAVRRARDLGLIPGAEPSGVPAHRT